MAIRRIKTKLAILILIDIISLAAMWSLVQSQKLPSPEPQMMAYEYAPIYYPTILCPDFHLVNVRGTILNTGLADAINVTLILRVILAPRIEITNTTLFLGNISGKSSSTFNTTIPFPTGTCHTFSTVLYEILWTSERSGFVTDTSILSAIILTALVPLLLVNLYLMRKFGFVIWLKERWRTVLVTVIWSMVVALIVIKSYWLTYAGKNLLFEYRIAWTEIIDWIPRLNIWDLVLIFVVSVIAGTIILDIETSVYTVLTNYVLSALLAIIYVTGFIWFALGYSEVFASSGGFLEWGPFVTYIAFRVVFRMIFPIVQVICLFGVLVGAFARGYLQPSAETYLYAKSVDFGNGSSMMHKVEEMQNEKAMPELKKKGRVIKTMLDLLVELFRSI